MKITCLLPVMWLKLKKTSGLSSIICLLTFSSAAFAQPFTAAQPTDTDAMQRITRARALAAIGSLQAALNELEPMRQATTDSSMQSVVRILTISIYLQQTDYTRAQKMLDEIYAGRAVKDEVTTRAYFALAGQMINDLRAHVERYRMFGLNTADAELPAEARNDLDRVRLLLEHLIEQAREIRDEDAKRTDATALLEDAASVRVALARNGKERQEWQREVATARHRIGTSETSIAGNSSDSTARPAATTSSRLTANSGAATVTSEPPLEVGSLADRATERIAPTYPPLARNARAAGTVTVHLVVDEKGTVESVQSTSGSELLRAAATDAARRWRFRPTLVDGRPVRVAGFVTFSFTL